MKGKKKASKKPAAPRTAPKKKAVKPPTPCVTAAFTVANDEPPKKTRRKRSPKKQLELPVIDATATEQKPFEVPENHDNTPPSQIDNVSHYDGTACAEFIESLGLTRAWIAIAIKYLWRAGRKEGEAFEKDVAKAEWYLKRICEKAPAIVNDPAFQVAYGKYQELVCRTQPLSYEVEA